MIHAVTKFKNKLRRNNFSAVKHKVSTIEGWLTENEAKGLYDVARTLPKKSIVVEIGSWKGKSTITIGLGLKKGKIFAIDPFNAEGESGSKDEYLLKKGETSLISQFIKNIRKFNLTESIVPLRGYSSEFSDYFDKIDFIFIDGDHSIEGCSNDYLLYASKLKKGGFIAFHDYYPERPEIGPTWVVNNLVLSNNEFEPFGRFDSLWVARKK